MNHLDELAKGVYTKEEMYAKAAREGIELTEDEREQIESGLIYMPFFVCSKCGSPCKMELSTHRRVCAVCEEPMQMRGNH